MKSRFTEKQILAAKWNAKIHGIKQEISDEQAIAFIEWYHSHKTKYNSEIESVKSGLYNTCTTGTTQQIAAWEDILKQERRSP